MRQRNEVPIMLGSLSLYSLCLCWFLDRVLTVSKNLRAELLRKLDVDVICAEVDGISQEQNSHNWLITVL